MSYYWKFLLETMNFNHNFQNILEKHTQATKKLHCNQLSDDIWEYFYQNSPNSDPISGKNVEVTSIEEECFIFESLFYFITTKSAIYITKSYIKFLNSDCLFNKCSSNDKGGAIYISCWSSVVQYRSCGYQSKAVNDGQHSYIYSGNSSYKNFIYVCSFNNCGDSEKSYTNNIEHGSVEIKSINTSFCTSVYCAGIYITETQNSRRSFSNITFSSFCNSVSIVVIVEINGGNYSINFCNFLKNQVKSSGGSTLYGGGSMIQIKYCSFLDNSGSYEFEQYSGHYDWGSIIVEDSYCDRQVTKGTISFNNIKRWHSTYKLSHYSSYLCEAKIPLIHIIKQKKSISTKFRKFSFSVNRRR